MVFESMVTTFLLESSSLQISWEFLLYPNNGLPILGNFETAVRLGPKISETVKGKLSLGAKILQVGGVEKIFKQLFVVSEDEKLLKASQCYLSTTAGPIAGLLFVSTEKVAFCSERSIKFSSPSGKSVRVHYKVTSTTRIWIISLRFSSSHNVFNILHEYFAGIGSSQEDKNA